MILGQLAAFDPRQQSDRADRMFIDGVVMVHIELHLRDDAAEIGHEAPEHARLVHPAQHGFGVARRREHVEEQRIGARIGTDVVSKLCIARRGAHRLRVDFQAVPVGERENLDQPDGVGRKKIVRRQRQPPAVEHEPVELARAAAQYG